MARHDFQRLNSQLLSSGHTFLKGFFPNGVIKGNYFLIGSLNGEKGSSLRVNLKTGQWQDFATGDKGTDLISLYAARKGITQGASFKELGGFFTNNHKIRRAV